MLQQTTTPPLSLHAELLAHRTWWGNLRRWARTIAWWPDSLATFALFMSVLSIVTVAMIMHIYLSAQILETRNQLQELQSEYKAIEMANADLVWQINQHTSLSYVSQRAQELGYQSIAAEPHYVAAADLEAASIVAAPENRASHPDSVAQADMNAVTPLTAVAHRRISVDPFAHDMPQTVGSGNFANLVQRTSQRFQNWWYGIPGD